MGDFLFRCRNSELSVDDLRTWQGVVLGRAVSTLRSVETQPFAWGFVSMCKTRPRRPRRRGPDRHPDHGVAVSGRDVAAFFLRFFKVQFPIRTSTRRGAVFPSRVFLDFVPLDRGSGGKVSRPAGRGKG